MKLTVTQWFPHNDEGQDGDYYWYTIHRDDEEEPFKIWGDHYHDNGAEKSEGFIEGVLSVSPEVEVVQMTANLISPMEEFPWSLTKEKE